MPVTYNQTLTRLCSLRFNMLYFIQKSFLSSLYTTNCLIKIGCFVHFIPIMSIFQQVVKMFILVIVIFGICWLPYHSYFIYTHFNPSILYMKYVQHVYLGFYWLAMANAMVNPIIYYWMNAK